MHGPEPFPAHPKATSFADALFELIEARAALNAAQASVPDYTGQHEPCALYAAEQEAYNRAVDDFAKANGVIGITDLLVFRIEQDARIEIVGDGQSGFWQVRIDGHVFTDRFVSEEAAREEAPKMRRRKDHMDRLVAMQAARALETAPGMPKKGEGEVCRECSEPRERCHCPTFDCEPA